MLLVETICVMFLARISEANYYYADPDYRNYYQLGKLQNGTQSWDPGENIALRQEGDPAPGPTVPPGQQGSGSPESPEGKSPGTPAPAPSPGPPSKPPGSPEGAPKSTESEETEETTTVTSTTIYYQGGAGPADAGPAPFSTDAPYVPKNGTDIYQLTENTETTFIPITSQKTTVTSTRPQETTITSTRPQETYSLVEVSDETTLSIHKETRTGEEYIETTSEMTTMGKSAVLNLPALMDLIMNLTGEFETNLTNKLNESLHRMSLPTCGPATFEPPTTSEYDANYTGSIVAKCFVCGLDVQRVPVHAHCADAFAGDFLPLVPVDPTARAQISKYRKYCKYASNYGYAFNTTQPRAIFGRWTGGCAVRWIDLSGIYTQRVCRSRMRPVMGRHYASKRMAKLERALWNVDNGCIVSPMATLVPLSRGVSLYARFHACVCTGNWCNRAAMMQKVEAFIALVAIMLPILIT